MVGFGHVASTSAFSGSSVRRRNEFHLSGKPFYSFNGSKFKAQNQRGSDPRSSHTNLENGLDNDVKFRMIVRRIGAGLENLGNTCFLNSVLQCLTHTEPLVAYLLSGKHQKSSCHVVGFCALCAIQNHVISALQSTGRILAPKDLVTNLRRISRNFRTSRQEDAHEYMVHLLESMHKCCLPSGVPYESPNAYEKSLVHKIFGGSLRSQVKCMQCSYCSNKYDPFLDLSLEIVKADSLHKALGHFTAVEQLDGGEKQYMCQQCKQKVRAVKQLTIDKAPYVLTIHLKRFGSHISGQKIDKKVQFGPMLNLKHYVSGSYEGELKYTLYGVLVHAGWSTHSGHYYCFVRTSSGIWYSLDDNRVRQVSEKIVLEQKAYMLFYVRDGINFGAGNIANAIQSQKMVPASMPNGSCNSTTSYIRMSIDKPPVHATSQKEKAVTTATAHKEKEVKTAIAQKEKAVETVTQKEKAVETVAQKEKAVETVTQKEKAVETAVENCLCSISVTCQGFQHKSDGKSDNGVKKDKVGASTVQKRSGENDLEGRLESSSPTKKLRSTDDSNVLVQRNLPNVHSSENLPKENPLQKPNTQDLSQSSMESKVNDSFLKSYMQHSTHPRKCNVGDPSADNVVPKVVQPDTNITSDDKSMKTDVPVSVAKPSEQPAGIALMTKDLHADMVQKTCEKARGAPREPAAKRSEVNNNNAGRSNGAVISIGGLLSKSPSHSLHQKPKKKAVKYNVPSLHLSTRILYGTSLSLRKRKKHKKVKKAKQKLDAENLMDEKSGPSTSNTSAAIEASSKISRKKSRHGSKRSCGDHVKHDRVSAHEDFVSELKRRTTSGEIRSEETQQQQGGQISNVKDSMNKNNGVADKPTKNLKRTAAVICNDVELPSVQQTVEVHKTTSVSIGYVADEWDEEYDRGKRKKLRIFKDTFEGPNPFQKLATKAQKLKKGKCKRKQYNLANQPFRI